MSVSPTGDVAILRDLATQYADIAADPIQDERRQLWRDHNSLIRTRPLIYMRGGPAWSEVPDNCIRQCEDPLFRGIEGNLRRKLCYAALGDDMPFEPWLTIGARKTCGGWGVRTERHSSDTSGGSWKAHYPIKTLDDFSKLRPPHHGIDEAKTAETVNRVTEAIGDILPIDVDRGPGYVMWSGDLSSDLGFLRGIENFMLDMMDDPEWLHKLVGFLADSVLRTHDQAERAGDWGLSDHLNQAVTYAHELPDPAPNTHGVKRSQLWGYMAAQEFELVSPAMHEEFLLRYQLPILSKFGLAAYGCCENLTRKIDMLRKIPNLRRIAVAPRADLRSCAEQIGTDYVISWRPNPAEMVCCGFDADRIRRIVREAMDICQGQHVDITLKDVPTVENEPSRLAEWTRIVREIAEDYA